MSTGSMPDEMMRRMFADGPSEVELKRIFDVIAASGALLLFSPILAATALVIRWRLGTPIFFRQRRPGLNGVVFTMLKFRTMRDSADLSGRLLPDAARLTRLGSFLRRTSLDELPELLNVLRGEMSIVGPRPLLVEYLLLYSTRQAQRHCVRPGVTGWAQVNGRNELTWEKKFELDVWYVENWSFSLDLRIIAMTICQVVRGRGVSQPGEATMKPFERERN